MVFESRPCTSLTYKLQRVVNTRKSGVRIQHIGWINESEINDAGLSEKTPNPREDAFQHAKILTSIHNVLGAVRKKSRQRSPNDLALS